VDLEIWYFALWITDTLKVVSIVVAEFLRLLSDWRGFDTWIAITGALAAMACALPGTWLLLRRQSLLGDALSHAVLPGIVVAFLGMHWLEQADHRAASLVTEKADVGEQSHSAADDLSRVARRQTVLFLGAAISGVLAALLTELIQRWGRLERSAALGVVFTSMFALGLLLIRLVADQAHIDADCVLYGNLETTASDTLAGTGLPRGAVVNGAMLLFNGLLVLVFFKELRLATFDPELATSLGLRAGWVSLALMTVTAATVVAAFESVGAILVIAMLIVPAATARLLTDRLSLLLILAPLLAGLGAVLGHVGALTLPKMICSRVGLPGIDDASTAGMMAVMTGGLFLVVVVTSPKQGLVRVLMDRLRLQVRIASEDLLGRLYRREEAAKVEDRRLMAQPHTDEPVQSWATWFARRRLLKKALIRTTASIDELTDAGRRLAQDVVRSHRLWESYMARHFDLPGQQLHATAERVEHYLGHDLQAELAAELDQPSTDPHGKSIPPGN
jgi:manganese/zinc/iron transport system permease protein